MDGGETNPPNPHGGARPEWQDIDGYRAREQAARGNPEALRKVATAWAASAGGAVSGDTMVLPKLPDCMALAELKALARAVGLEVRERLH